MLFRSGYSAYAITLTLDAAGTVTLHVHGNDRDTLVGIEGVVGSDQGDLLVGDAGLNALWGMGGADTLFGRDGFDLLYGMDGDDTLGSGLN